MEKVFIHPYAEVSKDAKIGPGTKVWNNAQIREHAEIGSNCVISKDVYIDLRTSIGNNCKIQNGVSVYLGVTIEDDVYIGPNVTFTNDKLPRAFNDEWQVSATLLKKGASVGAGTVVVCGITIGEYAMIGAGAVVTKDVLDYSLVLGVPAKFSGWICVCGDRVPSQGDSCKKCSG